MSYKTLIGLKAPAISLPDENGEIYNLVPGVDGRPVALFFYPRSGERRHHIVQ
jgi:peroxiredoxin Q/BCP